MTLVFFYWVTLETDFGTDLLAFLGDDLATETLFYVFLATTLATLAAFLAGIIDFQERFYLNWLSIFKAVCLNKQILIKSKPVLGTSQILNT